MKGSQKNKFRQSGTGDLESTGFEVQPSALFIGSVVFVLSIILLHFYGKMTS